MTEEKRLHDDSEKGTTSEMPRTPKKVGASWSSWSYWQSPSCWSSASCALRPRSVSHPSESMVPTLLVGDRVFVNKFIYRFAEPERGDVVVFESVNGGRRT